MITHELLDFVTRSIAVGAVATVIVLATSIFFPGGRRHR